LDEYYPISADNDQSYYYFMHKNFFDHININTQNIHILNGEADDPERECGDYEAMIENAGGIDLQVLGIGQTVISDLMSRTTFLSAQLIKPILPKAPLKQIQGFSAVLTRFPYMRLQWA
jgi:hypothetical protein